MSHWDSKAQKVVRWPEEPASHPGWTVIDCGCCAGLQWGGETPEECRDCGGSGILCRHNSTGTLALYPGGPFAGRRVPVSV